MPPTGRFFIKVYFGVKTIAPSTSKPAIIFLLNEGDNKSTLSNVINAMILEYTHWSDIFTLCSLLDNQKREIEGNKHLIFNLTMQCLDEIIIRNLNVKTNKSSNTSHFVLEELCLLHGRGLDVENGINCLLFQGMCEYCALQ